MEPPTGSTRLAAVIGSPIRHSLSPRLLNAAFAAARLDWVYVALEVAEGRAADALVGMRALGLGGLSVTTPHKEAVAAACDRLSDDELEVADLVLLDIKSWDPDRHRHVTGMDVAPTLEFARRLAARCPEPRRCGPAVPIHTINKAR